MYWISTKTMTALLYILGSLLFLNAVLLIFSVNGAKEYFRLPSRSFKENPAPPVMGQNLAQAEYKKAG